MLETGFSVNCRAIGNLTTKLLIGFLFCFLVLVLEQVYSLVIMILLFSPSFKSFLLTSVLECCYPLLANSYWPVTLKIDNVKTGKDE